MRRAQQEEPHGHNPGVRTLVRNSRLPGDSDGYSGRGAPRQSTTYVSLEQLSAGVPSGRARNTHLQSLNSLHPPQQPPPHLLPLHNAPAGMFVSAAPTCDAFGVYIRTAWRATGGTAEETPTSLVEVRYADVRGR
jgi:hypothetical protein